MIKRSPSIPHKQLASRNQGERQAARLFQISSHLSYHIPSYTHTSNVPSLAKHWRILVNSTIQQPSNSSILAGVVSSPTWRLIWPNPKKVENSRILCISDFAAVSGDQGPTLSVFWSNQGTLSGIGVHHGNASCGIQGMETMGVERHFAVHNKVEIPRGDWIRGFVLTFVANIIRWRG